MDSSRLRTHLAAIEPELRTDLLLRSDNDAFVDLHKCVAGWDGADLVTLFNMLSWAMPAYALARLIRSAPGFVPAEAVHLDEVVPDPASEGEFERIFAGDLVIDGSVDLYDGEGMVVLGDLHAGSVQVDETAKLVVTGTLTARSVWSDGDVLARNLDAELVYGWFPDGIIGVSEALRAGLLILDDHGCAAGSVTAGFTINNTDTDFAQRLAELVGRVPPSVVRHTYEDPLGFVRDRIDMKALDEHVLNGGSALVTN